MADDNNAPAAATITNKADDDGDDPYYQIVSPSLHILQLPPNSTTEDSYKRQWILTIDGCGSADEDATAAAAPAGGESNDSKSKIKSKKDHPPELKFGDMMFFPDNLSGAGEMEACRFVGRRRRENKASTTTTTMIELWSAGIEAPLFPQPIIDRTIIDRVANASAVRTLYEPLIETVLDRQRLSLEAIFGGKDVVEEFWSRPDINRKITVSSGALDEDGDFGYDDAEVWEIPLQECAWLTY